MYGHPKRDKRCAYCNYWLGDAKLRFVSKGMGYEIDNNVKGKCIQKGGTSTNAGTGSCCTYYKPNPDAQKLL